MEVKSLVQDARSASRTKRAPPSPASSVVEPQWNRPKTLDIISDRLDLSLSDAKRFVYDVMLDLADGDYHGTSPVPPPPADIYGTFAERIGWYIKFKLHAAPKLEVCGFHPAQYEFRTLCGNLIRRSL